MLLEEQSGNTKSPCFLCLWDSQVRSNHYKKKISLERECKNVINELLVEPSKVLLPPLHIKLGLMKQFVKALNKEGKCFQYIMSQFLQFSDAKLEKSNI